MIETFYFDVIDSTNTEAKRILRGESSTVAKTPFAIIANSQTAGRGRQGRSFYSPADTGLYMSIALDMESKICDFDMITIKTAVAVYDAIKAVTGIETNIKWVNDLYYNNRKVCGILAESVMVLPEKQYADTAPGQNDLKKFVIIGIGVNVSTGIFPDEIRGIAGSLGDFDDDNMKKGLISKIIENILAKDESCTSFLKRYKERSFVLGREVTFYKNNVLYTGVAFDISGKGELLVRESNGNVHILQSGEISLKSW